MLKYAGWDGIVVEGAAATPVWLDIRDANVTIRDYDELALWGKDAWDTQTSIWDYVADGRRYGNWINPGGREHGQTTQRPAVVAIGPAGENLSRTACLIHDASNASGQGGFGAIWGQKKLKVISVVGTGGVHVRDPTLIDAAVLAKLEQLIPLVPLHQPHNLKAIKAVMQLWPDLPQVACFDTPYHRKRAQVTERFGLPERLLRRGARRWEVHGLWYEYIAGRLRSLAPDVSGGRVIVAHLGSGASLCAMRDGRSVDTTMSFSALDGLPMGTRCGTLDPGVILFLLRDGWSVDRIEELLYKRSGLLRISGVSNDVRVLLASDCPLAAEAIEFFVYHVVREIGSLTAALNGLDAIVFTAGIGENSPPIRERVCQGLTWLCVRIDPDANQRGDICILPRDARHRCG